MINKKVFALTLVASSVIAAGCSSDDDGEETFDQTTDAVATDAQSMDINGDGILTDADDFNGDGFIDTMDESGRDAVVITDASTDVDGSGTVDGFDDIDRDGDVDDDDITVFAAGSNPDVNPDPDPMEEAFAYPAFDGEGDTDSVADVIANEPRLSSLAAAVPPALLAQLDFTEEKRDALIAANADDDDDTNDDDTMIPEAVDYTVFAPNDDALAAADLAGLTGPELSNVLLGHVVEGTVTGEDVVADAAENDGAGGAGLTALNGDTITFSNNESGGPVVNGDINFAGDFTAEDGSVSAGSQEADNGIVHLIDTVILPSEGNTTTDPTPPPTGNGDNNLGPVEGTLAGQANYSEFLQNFRSTLGGPSLDDPNNTWTVIAPTNDALDGDVDDIQDYVVVGTKFEPDMFAGDVAANSGETFSVSGSATGGDLQIDGNDARVIAESDTLIVYGVDGTLDD